MTGRFRQICASYEATCAHLQLRLEGGAAYISCVRGGFVGGGPAALRLLGPRLRRVHTLLQLVLLDNQRARPRRRLDELILGAFDVCPRVGKLLLCAVELPL